MSGGRGKRIEGHKDRVEWKKGNLSFGGSEDK